MNASNISITLDQNIPDSLETLLDETVYGSQGKLQYSHIKPILKLQTIANKHILTINRADQTIATVVFVERKNYNEKAFYVRYVSFANKYKTKRENPSVIQAYRIREQSLKSKLMTLLQEKLLTESNLQIEPTVLYAYIEEDNLPSLNIAQVFGYEKIRKMRTLVFNRFFPKDNDCVNVLKISDRPEMIRLLEQSYKDYNFLELTQLFDTGEYFVFKKDGKILSGIKVSISNWKIVHIPGFNGFLIQNILSKLPIFSRIFKKDQIKFLAFEAVWFKEGHEKELFDLMEAVCARKSVYMGMMWFDTNCKVGNTIAESSNLGLINAINKSGQAHVLCKFNEVTIEEKRKYLTNPSYISAFDLT